VPSQGLQLMLLVAEPIMRVPGGGGGQQRPSRTLQSSILAGGEDREGLMRGFRSLCETAALASIGEREGENGEGESKPALYRGCLKMVFLDLL
jgi:hypothetical protein